MQNDGSFAGTLTRSAPILSGLIALLGLVGAVGWLVLGQFSAAAWVVAGVLAVSAWCAATIIAVLSALLSELHRIREAAEFFYEKGRTGR